jgi:hypothetical protein
MATAKKRPTAKRTTSRVVKTGLLSKPKLNRGQLLAVVAMVVILGAAIVFFVRAATLKNAEPETWTASGGTVAVKADATAADGNYVEFMAPAVSTTPTTSPGDPALTDTAPAADAAWRPDADNPNTGVKDYSLLKPCAGTTYSQSGTATNRIIIENCIFTGPVAIRGDYITIRNSKFDPNVTFPLTIWDEPDSADYFIGENLDIIGNGKGGYPVGPEACIRNWGKNTIIRHSETSGCVDMVKMAGGRFEYNWFHDPTTIPPQPPCTSWDPQNGCDGTHSDGFQAQGGMNSDLVYIGNNMEFGAPATYAGGTWWANGGFQFGMETNWGAPCMGGVLLQNNWLIGYNYYWNGGELSGGGYSWCTPNHDIQVIGNRFYRQNISYGTTGRAEVKRNNVWQDAGQTRLNNQLLNVAANQAVNF